MNDDVCGVICLVPRCICDILKKYKVIIFTPFLCPKKTFCIFDDFRSYFLIRNENVSSLGNFESVSFFFLLNLHKRDPTMHIQVTDNDFAKSLLFLNVCGFSI